MAEWVHYFNLAAAASGFTTALLGLLIALTAPYVERWEHRYFAAMFSLLLAYTACDFVEQASQYLLGADFLWLSRAGVFLELLFSVAIIPLFTAYLLRCTDEPLRTSRLLRRAIALYLLYVAVLVAAQFGDAVYFLSAEDRCVLPGPFYPALVVAPIALMGLNLVALARRWNALTRRQRIAFAACTAVPLACVFLQAALFGLSVLVAGTSLAAIVMLGLVLADQVSAHIQQREEAAQQRARVLALQMRPHFIYNVMTSIYYLCAQDPARAQRVTLDFTDYLRANFNAISAEGDVPFAKELEHVRAYLAVESARLDDRLVASIDCPYTAFRLPPLTLQPLVENAVKHGADPELPPLHVRISTREEDGRPVVVVEDTGPGFGEWPSAPSSAPALDNIRERLAACGATLEIASGENGGTVATIRLPAEGALTT